MIVIDNFITDETLLAGLQSDSMWENNIPYSWIDRTDLFSCQQQSLWIELLKEIWGQIDPETNYAGVEYWSNGYINQNTLDWHKDKDEYIFNTIGNFVHPFIGSVWYGHTSKIVGGYLEIKRNGELERIEPVPNRLVIFDSHSLHRVAPVITGTRRAIASNVWINKPRDENFV